ncbi:MAG: UMP kinase [Elusimicrobiales bacterium]|nr:UMP kinase [Elusimicrobiales bacterium]
MKFKRVLLKISGEALSIIGKENSSEIINPYALSFIASEIKQAVEKANIQLAIVVGGGNIWRGAKKNHNGIDRVTSDNMGMLATVINALALQSALEDVGLITRIQTAINISQIAEPFIRRRAIRHFEKGRIVIFAGGTGNPFFTTDTAAALRASEINANILLKATQVDGVYDSDPKINKKAKLIKKISYLDAIKKQLKFMDHAALNLCMENSIPIRVFNLHKKGNIYKAITGDDIGTLIA